MSEFSEQKGLLTDKAREEIQAAFLGANEIVVASHTNPDGDALGSMLAVYRLLQAAFPQKTIVALGSDTKPVPSYLSFLPGAINICSPEKYKGSPDVFISCDVPNIERLNKAGACLKRAKYVIMIDHHEPEEPFADVSIISEKSAATALLILDLARQFAQDISKDVATCLYTGIMCDTGRFQFQNTNQNVFLAAAYLVQKGANPASIASSIYEQISYPELMLQGRVFSHISLASEKRIALSYITLKDVEECHATKDDLGSFVDLVRTCKGASVAVFLRELANDGGVRVNLRAKGSLDVSKVAHEFGGGGHKAAAGFSMKGSLSEVKNKTIEALEYLLDL